MSEDVVGKVEAANTPVSEAVPGTATPTVTPPTVPADPLPTPPGYDVLCPLGEGGMGVVYRARHRGLDRPVALKYLQEGLARHDGARARFEYEARVTAQLQHPGIPPVHEVGVLSDGRPFLAMKLIEGRTLHDLLREQGPGAGPWLAVFEAICQAVAYAHSRGVIHRDLKPANVMVGAFGEVQVMDWGLAKVLASAGGAAARDDADSWATSLPEADSARTPGTDPTRPGSVLGTPAFMAPEQAIGAIDKVDRRSDVFGLGAILCALLTGKSPFDAEDGEAARQRAATGKVADAYARLDGCKADADLIGLAKRCLAVEQNERPADAGELAGAVARLRREAEERARQAELARERAAVEAREQEKRTALESREQGKRRRLVRITAGAVIAALLAAMLGLAYGLFQADAKRKDAVKAKEEESRQLAETKKAKEAAEEQTKLARERYRLALKGYEELVFGIQNKLEDAPGTQELRMHLLGKAREGLRKLLEKAEKEGGADATLVVAHFRMGDVEMLLGNTQVAKGEYQTGHDLAKRLAEDDPRSSQAQRDLGVSYDKLGGAFQMSKTGEALGFYKQALEVRQKLAKADPKSTLALRDLSVSYNKLGDVTLQMNKTDEALGFFERGLEILQKLAKDDPSSALAQRDLSLSYDSLGDVTLKLGKTDEALGFYKQGLEISQKLAKDDPKSAQDHLDWFISHWKIGSAEMARHDYARAAEAFAAGRAVLLPWHQKKLLAGPAANYLNLVDGQLALCKTADRAVANLSFVLARNPEDAASLFDLHVRALLYRKHIDEAAKTADCFAEWAERRTKDRDAHRYDAARALALCAASSPQKDRLVSRLVALLSRARAGGYFDDPERVAHFAQDADFAAVRDHPAFAAFARSLKK